jgi:predicted aspartyl protease
MITGQVTPDREPVIGLHIQNAAGQELKLTGIVDTGFTDDLTLPPDVIAALKLTFKERKTIFLAGDIEAEADVFEGWVRWDGTLRRVLCLSADGVPLVGMRLLRGYRLRVDGIDGGPVIITRLRRRKPGRLGADGGR